MDQQRLAQILERKNVTAKSGSIRISIEEDLKEELDYINYRIELLGINLRISKLMRNQIAVHMAAIPLYREGNYELFDVNGIFRTIESLEKDEKIRTKTKIIKKDELKNIHKTHFFQASFLPLNLLNENAHGRGFNRIRKYIMEKYGSFPNDQFFSENDVAEITKRLVSGAFEARASSGRLTGEHIFHARYEDKNYYLFVESHNASKSDRVEAARAAILDFPSLAIKFPSLIQCRES